MHLEELLKHNHFQLQLRMSRLWFTGKTFLNAQPLNFVGFTKLLDNPTSRQDLAKFARQMNIYLYTPNPMLANRIWPCCLYLNSTYVTLFVYSSQPAGIVIFVLLIVASSVISLKLSLFV